MYLCLHSEFEEGHFVWENKSTCIIKAQVYGSTLQIPHLLWNYQMDFNKIYIISTVFRVKLPNGFQ